MRWIELDGAVNVRDVGGLPTQEGGETAQGRLLRADNLQGLSAADVAKLVDEHRVTTVVDLRSTHEVRAEGPGPLRAVPEVRHVHHSVLPEFGTSTDVTAQALLVRRERIRAQYPDDFVCGVYLSYVEDRPDSIVAALRAVSSAEGAALVHCAAGKDRTGVVTALALTAVGVLRDAVVADYVATGERIGAIVGRLRASTTYAEDLARIPAEAHIPRADIMVSFLNEIDIRYGGADTWLAEHGFTQDELDRLRGALLAPSDRSAPEVR